MGLIRAAIAAAGGTLADQWKDFLTVPTDIQPTAALFPPIQAGTDAGRGSNRTGSPAILSNGSKIIVPEGYGLLLFQEGELTAFASEPGGYIWDSHSEYSQSIFAGDSWSASLVRQSWERFKFGGRPGAQQVALFVTLKELPNNRFGTQSVVYWDDVYLNAQVGVLTHGTYSLHIVDPIMFAEQFVPLTYLAGQAIFDFTDRSNPAANQLFSELVGSLSAAFSLYTNEPGRGNRITKVQQDSMGFASSVAQAVEQSYQWRATRGLTISKVTIVGIEYDEPTRELLKAVQRADALAGSRGNSNLQASVAAGLQAAGERGGAGAVLGLGVAGGSVNLSSLMQQGPSGTNRGPESQDLVTVLDSLKRAFDAGLINQTEYDAAKARTLGVS